MKILDRSVFVGPSVHAHFPVIRLTFDLGNLEEWPSAKIGKQFTDSLLEALPGLSNHGCSYREAGGFYVVLPKTTALGWGTFLNTWQLSYNK